MNSLQLHVSFSTAVEYLLLENFLEVDATTTCFLRLIQPILNHDLIIRSDQHGQIIFSALYQQIASLLDFGQINIFWQQLPWFKKSMQCYS